MQLRGFRFRGTGHAGNFFIETEEVLKGNRRQRLVFVFDLHLLLGLNGLVHAFVIATSCQNAAGKAIHDHHFAVANDVVLIAGKELLGLQRVIEVGNQLGVLRRVEVINAELIFDVFHALFQDADGALFVVHFVVDALAHARRQLGKDAVELGGAINRAGDDEWGTGFIDKNRVHLIHDAEIVSALNYIIKGAHHVIA